MGGKPRCFTRARGTSLFHLDISADSFVDSGDHVIAFVKGQFVPQAGGAPIPVDIVECWTLRQHQIVELRPYYWNPKPISEYVTKTGWDPSAPRS
ncbi:hypothetical protein JY651_20505 [Pyxidicoccus parkwayensis]|uniref:Nuclear transport factor 2 family protein n=1 Tax=Pyxidicoccus parkwayensis TaxID=2813578 RepID=A0ABX7P9E7_9BACT|nr:hypothetical protein [Pyxidicoccus parkwaysis]QSQ27144.1 hypothetical protein JY651_20505 [Pyxidicoccus parkwaysis]